MPFTRPWDEINPEDTDDASYGAQEIRNLKTDIRERLALEHIFNSSDTTTSDTGLHRWDVKVVNSTYTVQPTDRFIVVGQSGSNYTITLPAANNRKGRLLTFYNAIDANYTVTISPAGTDTIQGVTGNAIDFVWGTNGMKVTLVSDGVSKWYVVDCERPRKLLAHAYLTSNKSGFTTAKALNWDAVSEDNGGFWYAANPSRFTIPSTKLGIKRVSIIANTFWSAPTAAGFRLLYVYKNGSPITNLAAQVKQYTGISTMIFQIQSPPIPVVPGDYIEIWASTNTDVGTIEANNSTFAVFKVEEYEY